tara:strand:- start:8723 stop:9013 length:291 start_codon:yes stop_codon:yes gene_type:complete
MKIELLKDGIYKISYSLNWERKRPDIDDRITIKTKDVLKEFASKFADYDIKSINGPSRITNFHSPEESKGEWIVVAESTKKVKKTRPRKKPKKEGV